MAEAAIQVENLAVTLQAIVRELLAAGCLSRQHDGIEVQIINDKIDVQLSVIGPAGLNSISRRTTTTSGQEVTLQATSEKTSTDTDDTFTVSQEAGAFVAISTVTKVDPEALTTRRAPLKVSTTTQTAAPDTSETIEDQTSNQASERASYGGDTVTRTFQYDED